MADQSSFSRYNIHFATLLLSSLAFSQAQAAVEVTSGGTVSQDRIAAIHAESVGHSLRNTNMTVSDLQELQRNSKRNADEIASLNQTINAQAKLIEEFKRGAGSQSLGNASDTSALKSKIDEQNNKIEKLESQISTLKRSSESGANANDVSNLKREISSTQSDLKSLKSTVDSLSNRIK
ncbi:Uncharacterized protein ALO57_00021 [Pseudomonas coronafaciens pv. oryzae]|uniref:hypothetical protein n=1 Tax=Pseudomonas coronafaciens TaxID=53409 RepID=UPI0006B51429|nr:hypothetical protein [Pseudomonas coronafaciens]KPB51497.1 Uncharacterized protein AC511_1655 [Pseudomonas coronafaciens pv. oryzae]KPY06216.1 Uncharacterized protein ALO57_00021 [Pseudomonas coronafaciens pv. oryzae]RMT01399.1 hypothetical protein ALP55_03699 [Pseudomonas coronafaciens pv. oryzae]